MELKVAALYMPKIYVGNPGKNRVVLEEVIRNCLDVNKGVDLAVGPELANVGYHLIECEYWKRFGKQISNWEMRKSDGGNKFIDYISNNIIPSYLENIPYGKTTILLENLAKEYSTNLVCGIGEIDKFNRRFNSAVFVSPNGYVGTYRQNKILGGILSPWVNGFGIVNQNNIFIIKKCGLDFGIAICAEITIPSIIKGIVKSSSLLVVPANWYEDTSNSLFGGLLDLSNNYKIPVIIGNGGYELFEDVKHINGYADPIESVGECAIISIPGKEIIKRRETIVKSIIF